MEKAGTVFVGTFRSVEQAPNESSDHSRPEQNSSRHQCKQTTWNKVSTRQILLGQCDSTFNVSTVSDPRKQGYDLLAVLDS